MKPTSNIGEKLSPLFKEIEKTLWEHEANNCSPIQYTDDGVSGAVKIFISMMNNKMWELQEKENMPLNDRLKMVKYFGEQTRKLILEATGIDVFKLYKRSTPVKSRIPD